VKTLALIVALLGFVAAPSVASPAEETAELKTAGGTVHGTLLVPESAKPIPVVLLIAGSGPTDRNGNSILLPGPNNSLKMLAEGLAGKGIASLRFDKRGIAESKAAGAAEKDLRFDMYVDDAAAWAAQLKKDKRFSSVTIAGHSEGALIGTVAAQRGAASAFVSIAGVSRAADAVLRGQLAGKLPPDLQEVSERALIALKSGKTVDDVPQSLAILYRPSVQPYLISWFQYDPIAEIKKVKVPILIVQGTTDLQVFVDDARALAAARPDARLEIIDGMNHVMKIVDADMSKQVASYSDPALPIAPRVVDAIAGFVNQKAEGRGRK
jgi:pimeloyl-ACP methyl ester carboxylesterase